MRHQILPLGLSDRQQSLTEADDVDLLLRRALTGTTTDGLLKNEIPAAEGEDQTNDDTADTHEVLQARRGWALEFLLLYRRLSGRPPAQTSPW